MGKVIEAVIGEPCSRRTRSCLRTVRILLRAGGFSEPEVGWSAQLIGALVALNNEVIASLTERIAAGEQLEYDNREVTDEEALREYAVATGDLAALAGAVERSAERSARAWSSLDERGTTYLLPASLVDSGVVVHDGSIRMATSS